MNNKMLELFKSAKSREEIEQLILEKITYEEELADKGGIIGIDTDVNPKINIYDGSNTDDYMYDDFYLKWEGYIPLGTKIVYSTWYDRERFLSFNGGGYYYVDDDSYIKEFVYSIIDEDIPNLESLINYIHSYLCYKLEKNINKKSRMVMNSVICKDDYSFFEPIKKHSIKDFYDNGSAMCTEYGVMAQNILSFLDIPSILLSTGFHAFQMIRRDDDYYVLDFSKTVSVVDRDLKYINKIPFFEKIGQLDEEWFEGFSNGDSEIRLKEYFVQELGDSCLKMQTSMDRVYKLTLDVQRRD